MGIFDQNWYGFFLWISYYTYYIFLNLYITTLLGNTHVPIICNVEILSTISSFSFAPIKPRSRLIINSYYHVINAARWFRCIITLSNVILWNCSSLILLFRNETFSRFVYQIKYQFSKVFDMLIKITQISIQFSFPLIFRELSLVISHYPIVLNAIHAIVIATFILVCASIYVGTLLFHSH